MDEDLIWVIDVALQLQRRKQTIFKILKRLGIGTQKAIKRQKGASLWRTLIRTNSDS